MGHAGADAEIAYRPGAEIAADLARDPLVGDRRSCSSRPACSTPTSVLARYDEIGWQVRRIAEEVIGEPKLADAAEVIAAARPAPVGASSSRPSRSPPTRPVGGNPSGGAGARAVAFGGKLPEAGGPLTLAQAINAALTDALVAWPQAMVFGEDVAAKGGVYGVTKGLRDRFGAARVFDTLLDETSILGLALGAGAVRAAADPGDPVPRLPALGRGPAARRGGHDAVLLAGRVPQPDGACGSPASRTRRGSAGTSTTTTRVAVLRDIPGLVVAVPGAARRRRARCCARA